MRERCNDQNHVAYARYGGRGIKVCDRWQQSFTAFLNDMGNAPTPSHSLGRIENDKGYEPGNVKWSTAKDQQQDRRKSQIYCIHGHARNEKNTYVSKKERSLELSGLQP